MYKVFVNDTPINSNIFLVTVFMIFKDIVIEEVTCKFIEEKNYSLAKKFKTK